MTAKINKLFKRQLEFYAQHGFTVRSVDNARGTHYRVVFNEFSQPQHLSTNTGEVHSLRNNVARFKRLQRGEGA